MLKTSNPIPINKDKSQTDLDIAYKFPEIYFSPNSDSTIAALFLAGEKGHPLYCDKCKSIKPERAHHCKQCNRCAPKMDHHCVWINGCVDEENYKQFFLFVLYVPLYCISIELILLPLLLKSIKNEIGLITLKFCWKVYKVSWIPLLSGVQSIGIESISLHWFVLAVLGLLFGLTLTGFAAVHFWYIVRNQTSIEYIANRPVHVRVDFDSSGKNYEVITMNDSRNMYNLGPLKNWCSVMGGNPLFWFVPFTKYTGNSHQKTYPYNLQFSKKVIGLAKAQRQTRLT